LLLDLELPVSHALAIAAPHPAAPVLFVLPQGRALLAGTLHVPRPMGTTAAAPTAAEIDAYLDMLNQAIPGLGAALRHVRRVFAGLLPAAAEGSAELQKRETLLDHARIGGLSGAYSVSGVKYTTANDVAGQVLDLIGCRSAAMHTEAALPVSTATQVLSDARTFESCDEEALRAALRSVAHEEAVQFSDDALLRRTGLHTACHETFGRLETAWHALELIGASR
jgi:glycerol-3-phosphate dehydrogenase